MKTSLRLWAAVTVIAAGGWSASGAEAVDVAVLAKLVEQQSRQIEELTTRLKQLETTTADTRQLKKELQETNVALAETNSRVDNKLQLGKGIDGLKLNGDLRVRYETRNRTVDNYPIDPNSADAKKNTDKDRTRLRERFRLGGVWTNKAENWEMGAGVATGNGRDNGLTTADGRSTDGDWGRNGAFDHPELWLDYAYAKHKWLYEGTPVSLTVGQQKSPFVSTLLTWDPDLRPQGLSLQYGDPQAKDYNGVFLTGGAYQLYYLSDGSVINGDKQSNLEDNVFWFATQAGYKTADWLALVGYQKVSGAYRNVAAANYGASQVPNNPYGNVETGYGYDILEAYAEYKYKYGEIEIKPYAHLAYNVSADGPKSQAKNAGATTPETENYGWMLGTEFKRGPWSLGYGYAYIGADSVFGPLRDNTFGDTAGLTDTDLQGHVVRLAYDVTKNVNVGASYYLLERINGGSTPTVNEADKAQLVQIEATYKF